MATSRRAPTAGVDPATARVSGALVMCVMGATLAFHQSWLPLGLSIDFLFKAAGKPEFSPVDRLSQWAGAKGDSPAPQKPRAFAALMGLVLSLLTAALMGAALDLPARVCALTLLGCAALEATLGYCLGCRIHTLLASPTPRRPSPAAAATPELDD